jgi:hypothetical protein
MPWKTWSFKWKACKLNKLVHLSSYIHNIIIFKIYRR